MSKSTVTYLIHFERPIGNPDNPRGQAQHYIGCATGGHEGFRRRIEEHRKGAGARIMAFVTQTGISWDVVRTWEGTDFQIEKRLKAIHKAKRVCPICSQKKGDK